MKKYVNGEYIDMTADEIAAMQEAAARAEAEEKRRPYTIGEVSEMLIRQQINTLSVDDAVAIRIKDFYPVWETGPCGRRGKHIRPRMVARLAIK